MNPLLEKRYSDLKAKVIKRKTEFNKLFDILEKETDWLKSPASTRFHLSEEEGLIEHSVNVAETLLKIKTVLCPNISDESCVIVALLHDVGKAGMPGNPQYLTNNPSETQNAHRHATDYPYRDNIGLTYLSIPIRSLYLCLPLLPLTEEEVQAIAYHDGQYVEDNRSCARKEAPLTLLLQYADNWCGFVIEN